MKFDSFQLAEMICKIDPAAVKWIYNKYCGSCAKFLYADELAQHKCKKCYTNTASMISRPIPFVSSATAMEKLISWVNNKSKKDIGYNTVLLAIVKEVTGWITNGGDPVEYRERIVSIVGHYLSLKSLDSAF